MLPGYGAVMSDEEYNDAPSPERGLVMGVCGGIRIENAEEENYGMRKETENNWCRCCRGGGLWDGKGDGLLVLM